MFFCRPDEFKNTDTHDGSDAPPPENSAQGLFDALTLWSAPIGDWQTEDSHHLSIDGLFARSKAGIPPSSVSHSCLVAYLSGEGSGSVGSGTHQGLFVFPDLDWLPTQSVTYESGTGETTVVTKTGDVRELFEVGQRVCLWELLSPMQHHFAPIKAIDDAVTLRFDGDFSDISGTNGRVDANLLVDGRMDRWDHEHTWDESDDPPISETGPITVDKVTTGGFRTDYPQENHLYIRYSTDNGFVRSKTIPWPSGSPANFVLTGYWKEYIGAFNTAEELVQVEGDPTKQITVSQMLGDTVGTADWELVTLCFELASGGDFEVDLKSANTSSGYIQIDEVRLLESFVQNSSFEDFSGGFDDWSVGAGSVAQETVSPRSGQSSCLLQNASGAAWLHQTLSGLTEGRWYEASVWMRTDTANAARLAISTDASWENTFATSATHDGSDAWVRLSVFFQAQATNALLLGRTDTGDIDIRIDDVAVNRSVAGFCQVASGGGGGISYKPTRHHYGLECRSGGILYEDFTVLNTGRFGFVLRCYAGFDSDLDDLTERTLFDVADGVGSDPDNEYRLYHDATGSGALKCTIRRPGSSVTWTMDTGVDFSEGDYLELAGWAIANQGGSIVLNGVVVYSTDVAWTALSVSPSYVGIGIDTAQANAGDWVFDELKLFIDPPTDDELVEVHTDGEPLENDNLVMRVNQTLDADDWLRIDAASGRIQLYDASEAVVRNAKTSRITGNYPFLWPGRTVVYLTADGTGTLIADVEAFFREHYL